MGPAAFGRAERRRPGGGELFRLKAPRRRRSRLRRERPLNRAGQGGLRFGRLPLERDLGAGPAAREPQGQSPGGARRLPQHAGTHDGQSGGAAEAPLGARPRQSRPDLAETSPLYPCNVSRGEFDRPFPPETEPGKVQWRKPSWKTAISTSPTSSATSETTRRCMRPRFSTRRPTQVNLELGSDDGLTVFVNGVKLLAKNVNRGASSRQQTGRAAPQRPQCAPLPRHADDARLRPGGPGHRPQQRAGAPGAPKQIEKIEVCVREDP